MRLRRHSVGVFVAILVGVLVAVAFATTVAGGRGPATTSGVAVPAGQPMDLVWISDSTGFGAPRFYARHIKQDLGVAVRIHNEWGPGLAAMTILEQLRMPGHPWIPLIRNAEVIVVMGNPTGLGIKAADGLYCAYAGCKRPPPVRPRTFQKYVATLTAIYKRIFEIRKDAPVILRTYNYYWPIISQAATDPPVPSWDECGITDECTKSSEALSRAMYKAAAAYRVPVADVYRAFNGKDHREDPVAKGCIAKDGIHPNNRGFALIAETLADLGYKPVKPPR